MQIARWGDVGRVLEVDTKKARGLAPDRHRQLIISCRPDNARRRAPGRTPPIMSFPTTGSAP